MRPGPLVALALRRLVKRPVRSILLLQGTVWGVAVAVFPSAVIQGTRAAAVERGVPLGADRITIAADPTASEAVELERSDVEAVRERLAQEGTRTKAVAGLRVVLQHEAWGGGPLALLEGPPEAPRARGLELGSGRWLEPGDPPGACVVEGGVWEWLGRRLAPGDTFRLPGVEEDLVVTGVARPRSEEALRTNDAGFDLEHRMFKGMAEPLLWALGVPYVADAWKRSDRCVYRLPREDRVDWVYVRVETTEVPRAVAAATEALSARGKPTIAFHAFAFHVVLGSEVDRFRTVDAALFLSCLVMGAVVMANLGFLTALRRAREIAVRRVEGATRADVAVQFLVEGAVLGLVGAGLGLALAMALAELRVSLEPVTGFGWAFPPAQAAIAAGASVVVGVLAMLLPALRASGQDPVEGLVDE